MCAPPVGGLLSGEIAEIGRDRPIQVLEEFTVLVSLVWVLYYLIFVKRTTNFTC